MKMTLLLDRSVLSFSMEKCNSIGSAFICFELVVFELFMVRDPENKVDVTTDDELLDKVLGGVSGGAVIGT